MKTQKKRNSIKQKIKEEKTYMCKPNVRKIKRGKKIKLWRDSWAEWEREISCWYWIYIFSSILHSLRPMWVLYFPPSIPQGLYCSINLLMGTFNQRNWQTNELLRTNSFLFSCMICWDTKALQNSESMIWGLSHVILLIELFAQMGPYPRSTAEHCNKAGSSKRFMRFVIDLVEILIAI